VKVNPQAKRRGKPEEDANEGTGSDPVPVLLLKGPRLSPLNINISCDLGEKRFASGLPSKKIARCSEEVALYSYE